MVKKIKRCYGLSKHKNTEGRTVSQWSVFRKYSRSSSAGAARASVVQADPGFCVSAEPGLVRSGSIVNPRASRPLRAPSPPWSPSCSCLSSSYRLPPLRSFFNVSSQGALPPAPVRHFPLYLALTLSDLHLQKLHDLLNVYSAAREAAPLHPMARASYSSLPG